jgi:hypothetical protein
MLIHLWMLLSINFLTKHATTLVWSQKGMYHGAYQWKIWRRDIIHVHLHSIHRDKKYHEIFAVTSYDYGTMDTQLLEYGHAVAVVYTTRTHHHINGDIYRSADRVDWRIIPQQKLYSDTLATSFYVFIANLCFFIKKIAQQEIVEGFLMSFFLCLTILNSIVPIRSKIVTRDIHFV